MKQRKSNSLEWYDSEDNSMEPVPRWIDYAFTGVTLFVLIFGLGLIVSAIINGG